MNIINFSIKSIFIALLSLAGLLFFSDQSVSSPGTKEDGKKYLNSVGIFEECDEQYYNQSSFTGCNLQLAPFISSNITAVENKNSKYNKDLTKLIEKYKTEHMANFLTILENSGIKKQKMAGMKGKHGKGDIVGMSGLMPDMDGDMPGMNGQMPNMGGQGPEMKGPGSDQRKGKKDTRVYTYLPPGQKVDVLFSTEQPNQPSDLFSYAGSLLFGTVVKYHIDYVKKYVYKNYGKQINKIDHTQKMVSSKYQIPAKKLKKMIAKNIFSDGSDEVNINFFFMHSMMGMHVNY